VSDGQWGLVPVLVYFSSVGYICSLGFGLEVVIEARGIHSLGILKKNIYKNRLEFDLWSGESFTVTYFVSNLLGY